VSHLKVIVFQTDIKTAYYKLSKLYHPDVNSNAEAVEMFKLINEAYEVLSNYRLKKLYDKGIIHTAGQQYRHHARGSMSEQPYDMDTEVDDETTKFYKSRLRREHTGKSKIYDFDTWTQEHYGASFNRKMENKRKNQFYKDREAYEKNVSDANTVAFGIVFTALVLVFIFEIQIRSNSADIVITNNNETNSNEEEDEK
jgi:DnaJ homolog subfamily C member 30